MDKINSEIILNTDDTLNMLDTLLEKWDQDWWDNFYKNKDKPIPFFVDVPDENLVSLIEANKGAKGKALDIGCGNGRNTQYLAECGYLSTGIDFSEESIKWAKKNAIIKKSEAKFINQSFFDFEDEYGSYGLIHDSGCLHHIKPHRREQYLSKIQDLLSVDGYFSLTCFNLKGGTNISDYDVYKKASMQGGLGYSEDKLRKVLDPYFDIVEMRAMKELDGGESFGKDICWVVRMKKHKSN